MELQNYNMGSTKVTLVAHKHKNPEHVTVWNTMKDFICYISIREIPNNGIYVFIISNRNQRHLYNLKYIKYDMQNLRENNLYT